MFGTTPFGRSPFGTVTALSTHILLSDALQLALSGSARQTAMLRARLAMSASVATAFEGTSTLRDNLAFEDTLAIVFHELLADSLALGATQAVSYTAIARMVDALLLGGTVTTAADAHALIQDALTFGSLLEGYPVSTLADGLSLSDSVAQTYAAIARLIDQLALSDAMTNTASLAVLLTDALEVGLDGSTSLDAVTVLRDRLSFVLQLNLGSEQYIAWTMNTNSKGASSYTNFPFNSFMRIGGVNGPQLGLTDTGLYTMGGSDDAGTPIDAKLRLGMSSMGTRALKRMASMYLGYTASGDLRVKVVVANEATGEREAHSYRLYAKGAGSMREGRVPIGKGLQAPYWDFIVENVDGADFDLDVIEILPLYLERRIRGNAGGK